MGRLVLSALALAGAALAACATENAEAIRQGAMEQCAAIGRANDERCIEDTMAAIRAAQRYDPSKEKRRTPPPR